MFTDLPLTDLHAYRFDGAEPEDFDAFWAKTLAESRAAAGAPVLRRVENGLIHVDTYDVTFSGFAGQPVRAWLWLPRGARGPLPAVVEYLGYGCGRGTALRATLWSSLGYAHLLMDSRGQSTPYGAADTPDGDFAPQTGGVLTRGLAGPEYHYYRRLFTDAVRAVDTVAGLAEVDPDRIAVVGGSQGGGIATAVAGLRPAWPGPASTCRSCATSGARRRSPTPTRTGRSPTTCGAGPPTSSGSSTRCPTWTAPTTRPGRRRRSASRSR